MANKTLYVKDEEAGIWEEAKETLGDKSLSSYITGYLKQEILKKKAEALGYEKILLRYKDEGKFPFAKSFTGRWIIPLERPHICLYEFRKYLFSAAITPKNNIALFQFLGSPDSENKYEWGKLYVSDDLSGLELDYGIPEEVVAEIMHQMGVEIEELDI